MAEREIKAKNTLEIAQQRVRQVEEDMETMKNRANVDLRAIQANIIAADNTSQVREEAPEEPKAPQPYQNVA